MKVVHLSTVDSGNGAAIAAYRIHTSLHRLGHDSSMFVAERRLKDPTIVTFRPPNDLASRVRRRLRATRVLRNAAFYPRLGAPELEGFSDDRSRHGEAVIAQIPPADIVNVHAMFDFLDYRCFLSRVPRRVPVVRSMHDISFITGGCHVANGCRRFMARCGACPRLGSKVEDDLSREIWLRKRAAFDSVPPGRLHLVVPSRWLAGEVENSALGRDLPLSIIPYGVDTEVFRPRSQAFSRELFSIPPQARVVLFISEPIYRVNKGFEVLVEALNELDGSPDLFLLSAGSGRPPVVPKIPHLHLGRVSDDRLMPLVYGAADLVALPSMDDNLPLTGLEALACGKPVVGFEVGGIPDIVRPGITGLLAPPQDARALGKAIGEVLQDPARLRAMEEHCRAVALQDYSLERQARRYLELYEAILAENGRHAQHA